MAWCGGGETTSGGVGWGGGGWTLVFHTVEVALALQELFT